MMARKYKNLDEKVFRIFDRHLGKKLFSWENFVWANLVLDSRQIWIDGKRYLVPVMDMINCCGNTAKQKPHRPYING